MKNVSVRQLERLFQLTVQLKELDEALVDAIHDNPAIGATPEAQQLHIQLRSGADALILCYREMLK